MNPLATINIIKCKQKHIFIEEEPRRLWMQEN